MQFRGEDLKMVLSSRLSKQITGDSNNYCQAKFTLPISDRLSLYRAVGGSENSGVPVVMGWA